MPTVNHFTKMFAGIWDFKEARKIFFSAKLGGAWRRVGVDEMIVDQKMVMKSMDPPISEWRKFTYLKPTDRLQKTILRIRPELEERMEAAKTLAVLLPTLPIEGTTVTEGVLTTTGRFSSKSNFQQFMGMDLGFGIDYSSIEIRLAAEQIKKSFGEMFPAAKKMMEQLKKIPWTLPKPVNWDQVRSRAVRRQMHESHYHGRRFDMMVIDDPLVEGTNACTEVDDRGGVPRGEALED